ncbi:DNA primase [Edaphocola flava]|jgi:DNA primase|uniref:DNA primase n=1 Tax=Edaphocola flava TaxID=2499629 RepID=UPI00100BBF20|nr:DNA primase [Edaphocola flava]
MISNESIQKVLNHTDIVDVIGHFISIKKRGANYIANCPFHNEKTPSFNINPAKGIFKCFGCGKGGDAVAFIEEHEKFSFVEAIRWLAEFYHIELDETAPSESYVAQQQVEESLRIINDFAANYFHDILLENEEGQNIGGSYFAERGFTKDTIEKFKLGYSLDQWDAFIKAATAKGFSQELMEKAGLIKVKPERTFDNYRGRVIFPIFANTGKVLGFGARILKKNDKAPKYVNSPENELYVKNRVLYGLYQSRKAISDKQECYLVEGYTDVISLHQAGIENVVASSGTSLTTGQLKLIGHLTRNLTILYDGDAAGIKAALRGLDMALEENFIVKLVLLPEGEDPDSYVQQNGSSAFERYVQEHKKDVIDFMMELGLKEAQNDPFKKSALVNEIAESISKIDRTKNPALQLHYIKEASQRLKLEEDAFVGIVNNFIREKVKQQQKGEATRQPTPREYEEQPDVLSSSESESLNLFQKDYKEEWQLIKMLIEYGFRPYEESPSVADYFFEHVDITSFENALAHDIAMAYYQYWSDKQEHPPLQFFVNHPMKSIKEKVVDLVHVEHLPSENWEKKYNIELPRMEDLYENDVRSSFAYFKLKLLKRYLQENLDQLKSCADPAEAEKLVRTNILLKQQEKELMNIVIVR